jgi:hypothetical protein
MKNLINKVDHCNSLQFFEIIRSDPGINIIIITDQNRPKTVPGRTGFELKSLHRRMDENRTAKTKPELQCQKGEKSEREEALKEDQNLTGRKQC